MTIRLWIDDLRPAPEGWVWVKTSQEAIQKLSDITLLKEDHLLQLVSFDHDLGEDDTSRPVLDWMIENDVWPAIVQIHTANPVGQQYLADTARQHAPGGTPVVVGTYAP